MSFLDQKLLRIGVFYDGGYFYQVSNYYRYSHSRKQRIAISGLHEFVRHKAAEVEGVDARYSQIVDSHFFRGRFSAQQTQARDKLYAERAFDDVLMNEGVTTHYLPMPGKSEKGVDVWLSLEAFEMAVHGRYNILVLVAGDSDFVPLVRKLNSLGVRVMVPAWDIRYTDDQCRQRSTTTSIRLLDEVTYPVQMHDIIDDKTKRRDPLIDGLFVESRKEYEQDAAVYADRERVRVAPVRPETDTERIRGSILSLSEGYGFIKCPEYPDNVFFHYDELVNRDFSDLRESDNVSFAVGWGEKGPRALKMRVVEE